MVEETQETVQKDFSVLEGGIMMDEGNCRHNDDSQADTTTVSTDVGADVSDVSADVSTSAARSRCATIPLAWCSAYVDGSPWVGEVE